MGTFPFFHFSKVGGTQPPNYVSKIWGQILGLYTGIHSIPITQFSCVFAANQSSDSNVFA